jgi:hypothetical protein
MSQLFIDCNKNLAILYTLNKKYEKSLKYYENALYITCKIYGKNSINYL